MTYSLSLPLYSGITSANFMMSGNIHDHQWIAYSITYSFQQFIADVIVSTTRFIRQLRY